MQYSAMDESSTALSCWSVELPKWALRIGHPACCLGALTPEY